jgi:hypothetical protein
MPLFCSPLAVIPEKGFGNRANSPKMLPACLLVVCEASSTSGGISTRVTGESHGGRGEVTTEI